MIKSFSIFLLILNFSYLSFADENDYSHAPKPCVRIGDACRKAKFRVGGWTEGLGLWDDCINPIMQNKNRKSSLAKKLPVVKAATIRDCKKADPNFGQGQLGDSVEK